MPEVVHIAATVTAETAQFHREIRKVVRTMQRTDKQAKDSGAAIKKAFLGIAGAVGVGLGIRQLIRFGTESIRLAAQTETAFRKMESVIKATGMSAGLSAVQLGKFADEMQRTTAFDADAVEEASAALLTFKTITEDTFIRAIRVAADLSNVFGTDLQQSTLQLGKALEEPVAGLTALRRSGISFSLQQKEVIQDLARTNRLAEAQGIILSVVEGQVGGTAKEAVKNYGGSVLRLGFAFDELRKSLVEGWTGNTSVLGFIQDLTSGFLGLAAANRKAFGSGLERFALSELTGAAISVQWTRDAISNLEAMGAETAKIERAQATLAENVERYQEAVKGARPFLEDVRDVWLDVHQATTEATKAAADVPSFLGQATVGPNFSNLFDSAAWQELGFRQAQAEARGREAGQAAAAGLTAAVDWVDPVQDAAGWARLGEAQAKAEFEARARVQEQLSLVPSDVLWVDPKENAAAFQDLTAEFQIAGSRGASTALFIGQGFAKAFVMATVAGESFGDAMAAMFKQMAIDAASRGILGLVAAGITFIATSGNASASFAAFQLASGTSLHSGGIVGGGSSISPRLASDEVPIIAQRGEMIVSKDDTRDMLEGKAGQSSGPVVLQINGREFGRLVGDMTRSGRVTLQ